jgi:hypothetical protein
MKELTKREFRQGANAWGKPMGCYHQTFVIDSSDVYKTRENYLGFGYKSHKFTPQDVGKTISVMSDTNGWTCWVFK